MTYTREQYMNNECTHRQYYAQFVTDKTKERVKIALGDKLNTTKDPAMNDIPLQIWDTMLLVYNADVMDAANDYLTLGGKVCILKEAARQLKEESNG